MANSSRTKRTSKNISTVWSGASKVYFGGQTPEQKTGTTRAGRQAMVQYIPYSNDDFRKRIAMGQGVTSTLLGNDYAYKEQTTRVTIREYSSNRLRVEYAYTCAPWIGGGILPPTDSGAADSGRASAIAAEKLVSDYFNARSHVNGGAIMAEATEVIRGLANPARTLRKEIGNLYQSVRRLNYRSARRQITDGARAIGGTWLEWKFAVDPLIKDLDDAATAINKLRDGDFRTTIPIRGVGVDEQYFYQGRQPVAIVGFPAGANSWCHRIDKCLVINRAAIRVRPGNGEVPLAWQFSTGVEDILPSVWEAIPWSWFVDYFVNVSSVLQAWSIISGNIAWANRTVRNSRTQFWSPATPVRNTSGANRTEYSVLRPGHAIAECSSVTRTATNFADLMPPLRARVPHTSTKWVNLAALSTMYTRLESQERLNQRFNSGRLRRR